MLRSHLQRSIDSIRRRTRGFRPLNIIELRRAAVLHNIDVVQRQHSGQNIIPVLKANAYGHGLREMADTLNGTDCALLAVDGYFEAGRIRHITRHKILVLGYILPENVRVLDTKRCSFVVQDNAGLEAFGRLNRPVRVHMELNTGMNRLGLRPEEIDSYLAVLKQYPKLHLEGIMSHLADADNAADQAFTDGQAALFDECVGRVLAQGFRPDYIHLAQTAGSAKVRSAHTNALRLGIGLYGINPLAREDSAYDSLQDLRPVLTLKSTIIKTIDLQPGESVSYGRTFVAPKAMRIGILPLGYYEGVPRELSNVGVVTHHNTVLPITGRVCMNHSMVDLGGSTLKAGDEVTVFSAEPDKPNAIARLSADHQLFPYTLLTGLSSSVRRRIV